jgi:hypothetical protein
MKNPTIYMRSITLTAADKAQILRVTTILEDTLLDGRINYFVYNRILAIGLHHSISDLKGVIKNVNCNGYTANTYYLSILITKISYILSTVISDGENSNSQLIKSWSICLDLLKQIPTQNRCIQDDILFSELFG